MADYVGADYVGDSDLDDILAAVSGDYDDDDEVGAVKFSKSAAAKMKKIAKMMKLKQLTASGQMPAIFLGFDSTIAASTSSTASSEANVKLRPTDLIVRDTTADDWQITSIRIGRVDLLSGSTGIPATAFTGATSRPPVSAPVLEAGTQSTIYLTNLTGASSRFMAMFTALDLSKNPVSP